MPTAKIAWLRFLVEGVVIVVSILLAFLIDAWWDQRNERLTLATALENVAAEVAAGREEISMAIDENLSRVAVYERFLSLAPAGLRALPTDSQTLIGSSFLPPRTFDAGGSALASLLAGGNLEAIPDPELRKALVAWGRFPDEIDEDYRITTSVALTLRERAASYGLFLALENSSRDELIPGAPTLPMVIQALRGDLQTAGLVAQLTDEYEYFASELAAGLALADQVVELIAR